jgi:thiol:disulfide interchange protein DsbA
MNRILLFSLIFCVGLAACSQEPAESVPSQSTPQQDQVVNDANADDAANNATADSNASEGDAPIELVEESAAEPEQSSDKPILLARSDTAEASQEWTYKDGQHFNRMVPTQPTVGGADKIEVAEFFWYGCAHCYTFEPFINRWAASKPANVRFVRIPATWNPLVELHAQLYYTEEVLVNNGKIADSEGFRSAVFREYHERGNRLTSMDSISSVFARFGVSQEDFDNTWNSFEVNQKLRLAKDLARRYAITGVPAVVVNGKYRTGAAEAGGYPTLLEVIDELVARESVR